MNRMERTAWGRLRVEVSYFAFDFHFLFAEIQQESDVFPGGDQVVDQLHLVCLGQGADGFQFYNDGFCDSTFKPALPSSINMHFS